MKSYKHVAVLAALASWLLSVGCERKPDPAQLAGHNVLLVTLDTTRADRLGCYGYGKARTPVLDGVAARGTLFEQAFAQVPLTLPSHSSIMTGRYPREHGVRDNARNALSDAHPTLAATFKDHGYRTAAFVASFVVDSRFGIDRGFEVFDDDMGDVEPGTQPTKWQVPANVVTDRALSWLDGDQKKPFFCWVHYYDPHDPYEPPEEFQGPDILPYDGEIAFVDTQVKRLFHWLDSKGVADRTLVVVVGDHGESFGEHEERGHTNFLYETNLRVPLFFVHPKVVPSGKRVSTVVEALDVFPTLVDLFGWDLPDDLLSRSLATVFAGGTLEDGESYGESLYVFNSYGWAEQRSLTTARWKYISSTRPELFDRQADPDESDSVAAENPGIARRMRQILEARFESITPGEADAAELSAEEISALRTLGYTGSVTDLAPQAEVFLSEGLRDPKDMTDVLKRLSLARVLMEQVQKPEDYALAIPLLTDIVAESPNTHLFRHMLATCYLKAGHPEGALPVAERALGIDGNDATAVMLKGEALLGLKKKEESLAAFELALALNDGSAQTAARCGDILNAHGQKEEAIDFYRQAVDSDESALRAHSLLCVLLDDPEELVQAVTRFRNALKGHEDNAEMQYNLGVAYLRIGKMPEAITQFQKALSVKGDYCEAACNLGTALTSIGMVEEAKGVFRRTATIRDCEAEGRYLLGVALSREGRTAETIRLYEEAIELKPTFSPPIEELSQHYVQARRPADAIRILRVGVEANTANVGLISDLAYMLAACQDEVLRDGPEALSLAQRAAELTGHRDPFVLGTLAAAYAEAGDFEKAVGTVREALRLLPAEAPKEIRQRMREQLAGYERGKPFRDPRL